MIRHLKGSVLIHESNIIELSLGQIILAINVCFSDKLAQNSEIELFISWQWNSETGPSLFGFRTKLDRDIFELVITCSGVGPKLALQLVGQLGANNLIQALATSDIKTLSSVSGVGARKAELMAAQLQPKAQKLIKNLDIQDNSTANSSYIQVQQVLESLNYSRHEIGQAIDFVRKDIKGAKEENSKQFDFVLRKALVFLSKSN